MTEADIEKLIGQIGRVHLEDQTDEDVTEVTTTDEHLSAQAENKTPHSEQRDEEPLKELSPCQEEVDKLWQKLETLRVQNKTLAEALDMMKERFNNAKAEYRELESNLAAKQTEVDAAEWRIQKLVGRKTDKDIQFREMDCSESSSEIQFDFVRTFYIKPKYSKGTMAYMEMEGRHCFARNGKEDDTAHGFISCVEYEQKADSLFNNFLCLEVRRTWLQHAEPKLMALYVNQFLSRKSLTLWDFQEQQGATSDGEIDQPNTIRIFVSRQSCHKCGYLRDQVNDKALIEDELQMLAYSAAFTSASDYKHPPKYLSRQVKCISEAYMGQEYPRTMATTGETTTNPLLEELKGRWSAQDLTRKQKQLWSDWALAKTMWNDTLVEPQKEKTELAKKATDEKHKENGDGEKGKIKKPFPFLELPGGIRNMTCDNINVRSRSEKRFR
ncbi:hypothetical protein DDE82_004955 [Stemphylium lycopersici]|nr:hypothetical protein DDE82_004955 [Stemphylium lycopersici]